MQITTTIPATRAALKALRSGGKIVALVPTMGALHAGHMSLIAAGRAEADLVAASIFVNPLQFAPTEDLARYPRPFEADRALLEAAGVDLLFAPNVNDIYPRGQGSTTTIDVPELSSPASMAPPAPATSRASQPSLPSSSTSPSPTSPSSARKTPPRSPSSAAWSPTSTFP